MKQLLGFLILTILFVIVITGCKEDGDCKLRERCNHETGNCELQIRAISRQIRKVEMCLHDGQCPARFRCVVFFCVYVGPDDIPQRHDSAANLIAEAFNETLS